MPRPSTREAIARRLGLSGMVDFTPCRIGQTLHIPCSRGHLVDFTIAAGLNPEGVAKRMLAKGWIIGRKLICPDCRKKKKGEKMPAATAQVVDVKPTPTPSPAAGRARRLVYMALEDYYDETTKLYRPGHSDASIAKECGIAENVVKTIREESFGPLAEPTEITAFRAEIEQVRKEVDAMVNAARHHIQALENRLGAIAKKGGWE